MTAWCLWTGCSEEALVLAPWGTNTGVSRSARSASNIRLAAPTGIQHERALCRNCCQRWGLQHPQRPQVQSRSPMSSPPDNRSPMNELACCSIATTAASPRQPPLQLSSTAYHLAERPCRQLISSWSNCTVMTPISFHTSCAKSPQVAEPMTPLFFSYCSPRIAEHEWGGVVCRHRRQQALRQTLSGTLPRHGSASEMLSAMTSGHMPAASVSRRRRHLHRRSGSSGSGRQLRRGVL